MDTFGKRLKYLRSLRNKQQKEVAIDLDISKTGYSSYENDIRMPGVSMLIKIADYYNVSIDFLLGRDDSTHIDKNEIQRYLTELFSSLKMLDNYIKNCK